MRRLLAALVLVAAVAGCATGPGVRADRVEVGQCFDDPSRREVARFDVVPCGEPHDNEVFFVFDVPGERYPGRETLTDIAAARCTGSAFRHYVGIPLADSDLRVFEVLPTRETWAQDGDREVVCALYGAGGRRIVGSAKGNLPA